MLIITATVEVTLNNNFQVDSHLRYLCIRSWKKRRDKYHSLAMKKKESAGVTRLGNTAWLLHSQEVDLERAVKFGV